MRSNLHLLSGQTILEILVAAAIITTLFVGLLSLNTNSMKGSTYTKELNQANEYASQLADWLKNQKNTLGWTTLFDLLNEDTNNDYVTYCFNNLPTSLNNFRNLSNSNCPSSSYITNTNFQRSAVFDLASHNQGIINVEITVQWEEGAKQVNLNTQLNRWN